MDHDTKFAPDYLTQRVTRERLHKAMLDYLEYPEQSLEVIAERHKLTATQLSKQVCMNILPDYRRWAGTGKSKALEPSDRVKKIMLDALKNGHPYSALTNNITPQMSRYYKHRWRHWLVTNGHLLEQ
jgi:hypothetical protein